MKLLERLVSYIIAIVAFPFIVVAMLIVAAVLGFMQVNRPPKGRR